MAQIISLEELPEFVDAADAMMSVNYDKAIQMLAEFEIAPSQPSGMDPFSPDYTDWVMSVYLEVTGNTQYIPDEHEADRNVTVDMPIADFFPFLTRDTRVVGNYLSGVSHIMRSLDIAPNSKVIEYGVGWGHVSFMLARTGHDVACVDIEPKFLSLVAKQAAAFDMTIRTHEGEFGDHPYEDPEERADAVVFFEAFHHALKHVEVVENISRNVLRPGGVMVLAAEPVFKDYPFPWGIRFDGQALWAVRQHHWMELGFDEDYLVELLVRNGFIVQHFDEPSLGPFGNLYRCQLGDTNVKLGGSRLPRADAQTWTEGSPEDDGRLWASENSTVSLDGNPAWASVSLRVKNFLPIAMTADITVSGVDGTRSITLAPGEERDEVFALGSGHRRLHVASQVCQPAQVGMGDDKRFLGIAIEYLRYLT